METIKNFALIGAAGYIAPRHMQAISETGNRLIAAVDPHDAAGILDRYFSDVPFFTEIERFDRYLEKLRRSNDSLKADYISVCSPNYLHDAHVRMGLRLGANVICEKPLVINPWNIDAISEVEAESKGKVYTVLQLRLLPELMALKEKYANMSSSSNQRPKVVLTYITKRGPWYHVSWKGHEDKSGGIMTNIGIHFFDFLLWVFGSVVEKPELHLYQKNKASGFLSLEKADVSWFLSTDKNDLPEETLKKSKSAFRSILIDGNELEFSDGFTDLHTKQYKEVLSGRGFGLERSRPAIDLVYNIRNTAANSSKYKERAHPVLSSLQQGGTK